VEGGSSVTPEGTGRRITIWAGDVTIDGQLNYLPMSDLV